jgi:hypothetical protein
MAQSGSLFLTREDGQLLTKCDVFQGDLLVTTEDENNESNPTKKRVQREFPVRMRDAA